MHASEREFREYEFELRLQLEQFLDNSELARPCREWFSPLNPTDGKQRTLPLIGIAWPVVVLDKLKVYKVRHLISDHSGGIAHDSASSLPPLATRPQSV